MTQRSCLNCNNSDSCITAHELSWKILSRVGKMQTGIAMLEARGITYKRYSGNVPSRIKDRSQLTLNFN